METEYLVRILWHKKCL